jgi:hypothetical protein
MIQDSSKETVTIGEIISAIRGSGGIDPLTHEHVEKLKAQFVESCDAANKRLGVEFPYTQNVLSSIDMLEVPDSDSLEDGKPSIVNHLSEAVSALGVYFKWAKNCVVDGGGDEVSS